MRNVHTLDNLNTNNSNSITITQDSVNDGTQLLPVLKLRGGNNEVVQSALDKAIEENLNYNLENGSSSIRESFPYLYPPIEEEESPIRLTLFDIIKNIYGRIINSSVDIDENNINTLSDLIRNDPSSVELSDEIKNVLNNVIEDLNSSINNNGLKPLGTFGDITLNELILKGQNLDFSFLLNNQELTIYPLKLIPIGIVYGTIVRLFMKNCDDYNSIHSTKDVGLRTHLLRIRRVNIVTTLAITAPLASALLLKFGKLSIFDGIKFEGKISNPFDSFSKEGDNIVNNELKSIIPIFTLFFKKRPKLFKFFLFLICTCSIAVAVAGLYKYNILNNIISFFNIYCLFFLWVLILIFNIVYNSIGFFILNNKNEKDIDLSKIRIKYIRNTIESFIFLRNSNIDKDSMKKYFIKHLYLSVFVIIISIILFFI